MRKFDIVICALGSDETFNQHNRLCLDEQVKDSNTVGIILQDKDDMDLMADLKGSFDGTEIIYEFIHLKREETVVCNGFIKELQVAAVIGKKECFENKNIKTFYNSSVKEAIHSIITDVAEAKSSVLYTFSEPFQAVELDPLGTLARKKISVEYLAKRTLLKPVINRMNKKNVVP